MVPRRKLGDFDCSGADIERDWVSRGPVLVSRHQSLTHEQVQAYGLPAAEGKKDDRRWLAFARRHGFDSDRPVQWEVEAIDPAELRRLVLDAVEPYVDWTALTAVVADELRQRRDLSAFLRNWPGHQGS